MRANPLRMGGAILAQGAFTALKKRMNPEVYGGAPLLGLRGNVLKAHGSSSRHAIKNAIRAAHKIVKADMLDLIVTDATRANLIIRPSPTSPKPETTVP
jgi:glycerol-3-phosphate acyltransferase PlsX